MKKVKIPHIKGAKDHKPHQRRAVLNAIMDQAEAGHINFENETETPLTDGRVGKRVSVDIVETNPAEHGAEMTV